MDIWLGSFHVAGGVGRPGHHQGSGHFGLVVAPPLPRRASWTHVPGENRLARGTARLRTRLVGMVVSRESKTLGLAPLPGTAAGERCSPSLGDPEWDAWQGQVEWGRGAGGQRWSGVPGPASELSALDKRVQAPVNFTQTAFDRSLVIFGELSHKFVPSCCRNLLSGERGRKGRQAGRSSADAG